MLNLNYLTSANGIQAIIVLVIAIIACFFGYKSFRPVVGLICFFIGLSLGLTYSAQLINNVTFNWIIGIIIAVMLAFIGYKASHVGLALWIGYETYKVASQLSSNTWLALIIGVGLALIVGLLVWKLKKPLIIVTTALAGGFQAVTSIFTIFSLGTIQYATVIWSVAVVILIVLGMLVQFKMNKKVNN